MNAFITTGIAIYIVMSGIDKFVHRISNTVYITMAIIGIALILTGAFLYKG